MSVVQVVDASGNIKDTPTWFPEDESLGSESLTVFAMLGPQGSGKSTLLNAVFGTAFHTAPKGSLGVATSKGIAAAKAAENDLALVLDVEGADARERGKAGKAFQDQCAGFVAQLADVILVNLWYHDVGRLGTAPLDLLEVVFKEALADEDGGKTLVRFVVRDAEDDADKNAVVQAVLADAATVWDAACAAAAGKPAVDMHKKFNLDVVLLPHFKYSRPQFDAQCAELGAELLENSGAPGALVKSEYSKGLPVESIGAFAKLGWDSKYKEGATAGAGAAANAQAMAEARELPATEQGGSAAAIVAADQIFSETLFASTGEVDTLMKTVESGEKVDDLGNKSNEILTNAIARFSAETAEYSNEPVVARKKRELEEIVDGRLHTVFLKQLQLIRESAIQRFKTSTASDEMPSDFAFFTSDNQFNREANAAVRPGSDWNFTSEYNDLQTTLQDSSAQRMRLMQQKIQAGQQQVQAMQYLQMQQGQAQAMQQQQYGGGPGQWNIGAAYRPPETNINMSLGYQQGRTNIQVSMVPDEQAGLLGPSGFTSGVGPGNLGLSFNVNV
eukprot:CAMPEP_0174890886 /NCGR_PEP_ID=MMETSP0167-20121228/5985_1 /TAXON_ID=38298 /ORGANISM="Rhodella maculata, Strain CCMP736" /LENGTH=558 /DNA_ID=CAMNT_0016128857 /DNA_START=1 /DNA_END=1677 /DNA_ORIENTATION=+